MDKRGRTFIGASWLAFNLSSPYPCSAPHAIHGSSLLGRGSSIGRLPPLHIIQGPYSVTLWWCWCWVHEFHFLPYARWFQIMESP